MVSGRHVCTEKGVSPPSIQTQALYRMLHLKFILQDAGSLRTFFKGVRLLPNDPAGILPFRQFVESLEKFSPFATS